MKTLPFYLVDVFAEAAGQGNQLCVLTQTDDLTPAQMLGIAREINFPETTFVSTDASGFWVRIFTPEYEVPFAGHPLLGTAWLIANRLLPAVPPGLTLHVPIGPIPIRFDRELVWLETAPPRFGPLISTDELAPLLHLPPSAFAPEPGPELVSTGMPYVLIPLVSREALGAIRLDSEPVRQWLLQRKLFRTNSLDGQSAAFYAFYQEASDAANQLSARAFFYENGRIVEDAATGSAASCLLAYRLKNEEVTELAVRLEQGHALNRPSLIWLAGRRTLAGSYQLRVGGKVRPVAQGNWFID